MLLPDVAIVNSSTFAKQLNLRVTIQKTSAILLLVVFAISIAPRTYFHDLVADHKDVSVCNELHRSAVFHAASYHCHFDDLVVAAPFLPETEQSSSLLDLCFQEEKIDYRIFFFPSFFMHKENRGPPAVN